MSFNVYATAARSLNSYALLNVFQAYLQNTLLSQDPDYALIFTEDGVSVRNLATGVYHRMLSASCGSSGWLKCARCQGPHSIMALDNEIAIDLVYLPAFVSVAKAVPRRSLFSASSSASPAPPRLT